VSPGLDARIVLRTLGVLARRDGINPAQQETPGART